MNHKLSLSAAALGLALSCTAATAATVELVQDGGFESGTSAFFTSDFTEVSPAPTLATFTISTGVLGVTPNTGSYFMAVNGDDNPSVDSITWAQSVDVTSGTEYAFSFAMADWSGTSPDADLSIRIGGIEILRATSSAAQDVWETFATSWTSTLTGTFDLAFVELSSGFGGNDYTLDDISLTYETAAVPLPAPALLLMAGLAGLFGLRRRQAA